MPNLFYEEPDSDRWLPFDRYPRKLIRRMVRGKPRVGGQQRVFLNLCAGLDRLGVKYRINDYGHIRRHPDELACIIGKPHVLDKMSWKNPILFGAAVYSHPLADPDLLKRLPIRKVLVPCEWMRVMCEPYWGDKVAAWPVGIDTERWKPIQNLESRKQKAEMADTSSGLRPPSPRSGEGNADGKTTDFLIYDKVMWGHDRYDGQLIQPIRDKLIKRGLSFLEIRYGYYEEQDFHSLLQHCKAMIFLCEQDPEFYPHRVKFAPVSSVPYWDDRCGLKYADASEFSIRLDEFWQKLESGSFRPRDYILENLTLKKCAQQYLQLFAAAQ
jgi:glycosyltransferase involved in cell wall biosynthesis